MYISFNEKIDKKSLVTYPMSSPANNIPFFNVVFSSKAATSADIANYGLIPMYVTSPVKKAKTTKTTETKPSQKKPKTAGAFETARYDTAKISVVADSDNKKYVVSFSTYVDEERTVLLKRLGYKLNTVDKTWSHPMIDGSTIETALAKLVEGLEKIERLSSIVVQAPAKIETEDDGVVIKEISYEQREVEPNVDGGNSDAINNIDGAMKFHNKTEKGNPLQAIKDFFVETFGRGELPNLPRWQYGNLRALLLQNLRASNIAASMAENYITIYNRLNPEQYKKAMRVIVLRDIVDDAVNLRLDIETNKTWGFNNLNEVAAELYKAEQSMYADPIVETVVNDRNEILETIRELYIENAKIAGYDANVLFTHSDYFHHSVQDIEEAIKSVKSGRNALMDSWIYEQRHNANKPYLTDPALADYMTMHQMFRDIKKMELLGELKRLDRSKEFPPGKKLPEGYVQETVSVIGYVFPEDAIADSLEKIAIDMADVMGLTGADKEAYIKEMRKQMPAKRLVIPTEVAKTCRALLTQKDKSKLDKATKQAVKAWKYIMIKAPHRIVNYNVRNFVGDLDAMLAAYPGAVKYIAQSYGDLRDFFKDIPMTPEQIQKRQDEIASGKRKDNLITDYIWSGGMTTGLSDVEFQNFQRYGRFDFYGGEFQSEDPSKIVSAIKGALGKKGGIETFTQFREQLLRYATFLYLMNEGMDKNNIPVQGKAGKVVNFGASYVPEILSLRSRVGRAAKLANDALGAYDDVSMFAAKLSDSAIPFFRFKWINATRYFNLFRNAFMSDQKALAKAGLNVAKRYGALGRVSASAALRLGRLVAMGSIVTLTQVLANTVWNLVDEDEPEKDLPDYVRDSIHLYLGAIGGRSHYYTGLGSIGDLADFLGIYTAISDFKGSCREAHDRR